MPQKASKPRQYGKRELILAKKPEPIDQPLYVLLDDTKGSILSKRDQPVTAKQCMCPDCQKTFPVDIHLAGRAISYANSGSPDDSMAPYVSLDSYNYQRMHSTSAPTGLEDLTCPECGKTNGFTLLTQLQAPEPTWQTPMLAASRTISKYTAEDGSITRIDDRYRTCGLQISQGRVTPKERVVTEVTDLLENDIYVVSADIAEDRSRRNETKITSVDPFLYRKETLSVDKHFGVRRASDMKFANHYGLAWNPELSRTYNVTTPVQQAIQPDDKRVLMEAIEGFGSQSELEQLSIEFNREKLKLIEQRFAGLVSNPLYADMAATGMYLKEHHPGSTEENTELNPDLMNTMASLMVRYPCIYLHAAERTDLQLKNRFFDQKRKQEQDPSYTIKEPSDSAKARILRGETTHMIEELAATDDRVSKSIKGVMSPDDMRKTLAYFALGPDGERDVPKTIHLKPGETPKNDPFKATKQLKRAFQNDPLATAANVYTGLKLGLKTTDHLNQLMQAANNFKNTESTRRRSKGVYVEVPAPTADGINAGIIAPMRTREMMSFMKRFANSHNPTETIQSFYGDSAETKRGDTTIGYGLLMECLRMYGQITTNCKIADTKDEIKENYHNIMKNQIRNYLEHKSIQDAYVDFVDRFGSETPEVINGYAAEIIRDDKIRAALECYDTQGLTAAMETHPILAEQENPAAAIIQWREEMETENNVVLTTRNGKPLFQNRTLREIHDELSVMSTKCLQSNRVIQYTEAEKKLESSYQAPDADGTWSFRLMKDSNDIVRTATELHNCVASYIDTAVEKKCILMYMEDERAAKVGCIELKKAGSNQDGSPKWVVSQFQGDHDDAMPARFAGIAKQWLVDQKIDFSNCPDVARFGTGDSIYGGHDADYHHQEVDEAEGIVRTVAENKRIQQERYQKACETYGIDPDGKPVLPSVPTELSRFN